MPLLKGEPLDARLTREGRLSIPAVLKLGLETAEGLAAAHAQGLVHRDIKPANLWLEGTGDAGGAGFRRVKILDFGLARAVQDDQHLTAEGGLLGTPAYMAPEQAAGEGVDHRADLFNLGAVLYRCCAGETPFPGKTTAAVMAALLTKDAAPVGDKNPNLPAALANLIMRLLDKAPAGRPQTAAGVADRAYALNLARISVGLDDFC
jgi:serine/threonine protein kinase